MLMCVCLLSHFSCVRLFVTLWTDSAKLLCPWHSPGKILEWVASHALLQGIFPAQGLNPSLLYCRWILYHLSHQGSPSILDWATYPFSRGSSWPRNWTGVSCIVSRFFPSWATREAPWFCSSQEKCKERSYLKTLIAVPCGSHLCPV